MGNRTFTVTSGYQGAIDLDAGDSAEYPAELDRIEDGPDLQYGPTFRLVFNTYIDGEPEEIDGLASKKASTRSKLVKWAGALLGHPLAADEEFTLDDLEGKPCRVTVEMQESGFPRVIEVKSQAKKKRSTEAAAAA